MIGLDTNVLVRYLARDDAEQSPRADAVIQSLTSEEPGFIPIVTLIELVWVMQRCYSATRSEVVGILGMLFRTKEFTVENAETAIKALHRYAGSKADYSDSLMERSANAAGCKFTVTFDQMAASSAGMQLIS
jgi:predicted nucleic-acid-binding protein